MTKLPTALFALITLAFALNAYASRAYNRNYNWAVSVTYPEGNVRTWALPNSDETYSVPLARNSGWACSVGPVEAVHGGHQRVLNCMHATQQYARAFAKYVNGYCYPDFLKIRQGRKVHDLWIGCTRRP